MQLQRIRTSDNQEAWLVLDANYFPVKPITEFIRYLVNTEKSPNTIRSYANHLRLYWEFLEANQYDWLTVTVDHFSRFVHWLRSSYSNVIYVNTKTVWHEASSVNTILSVIASFYRFHQQCGRTNISLTKMIAGGPKKTYSMLHHIFKRYPQRQKVIKLREPKELPKTLTSDEVKTIINHCENIKERLLVTILAETGMRIGQLLGLQHQDIKSWDNELHIIPRRTNGPDAQAKRKSLHVIHIAPSVMQLYADYCEIYCKESTPDDFLFTKRNKRERLTYSYVRPLFKRLSKPINKPVTPHMLRHAHATELLRAGWDASYVQKRLGHAHVQTTLDIYSHLSLDDLKREYQNYLNQNAEEEC
jgi:integrase/recombinase XerD